MGGSDRLAAEQGGSISERWKERQKEVDRERVGGRHTRNREGWRMRNRQCAIEGVKLSKTITESGTVRN